MYRHSSGSAALFLQPELVVFGPDSQHLRATLRTAFVLARHTALVRHACIALGADTLAAFSHRVMAFSLGHFADLLSAPEKSSHSQIKLRGYALPFTAKTPVASPPSFKHSLEYRPVRTYRSRADYRGRRASNLQLRVNRRFQWPAERPKLAT